MLESSARFYRHLVAEVADGAERIVWPKPPKARPGCPSES